MKNKLTILNIIERIKKCKSTSTIVVSINKNKELYKFITDYTKFLDSEATLNERLYCIKNDITKLNICNICDDMPTIYDTKYNKYKNWCDSSTCKKDYIRRNRDPEIEKNRIKKILKTKSEFSEEKKQEIINKTKQTLIEKYGVDSYAKTNEYKKYMIDNYGYVSPFELKETHNKSKQTLIEKYGVNHNFNIIGIQDKIEQTFLDKYGYKRPSMNDEIKNKIIETNNNRYGGNSPMHNKKIQNKAKNTHLSNFKYYGLANIETLNKYKDTMLNRYGYSSVMHNNELFNKIRKSTFKYKTYKLPSGKNIKIQGYEDYTLTMLLKKYNESDIIIDAKEINEHIGQIYYLDNNIKRRYYPDFYIKSENLIIEVKSNYTYKKDLKKNLLKKYKCIELGYNFMFDIINKRDYKLWKKSKQ